MTSDPGTTPDSPVADTSIDIPVGEQPPLPATKPVKKEDAVKRTRAAATWTGVILGLLLLILLLIFITQNMQTVETSFLAWHLNLPLGVTVLTAAVTGALLTALVGIVRIVQLRRAAKKNLKA
ncbi:MAG: LapA family protein [Mycobacterium sp.]